ncbi:MAG: HAD family phosphatase [Parachlamydiales bacterium]|nr:HAD family phosphatase [Parachlamydiales bacterium]
MKGWIALDVDGTLTKEKYSIPLLVTNYLRKLSQEWFMVILTGRSFSFSSIALQDFDFPYFFCVQNGSAILEMPQKKMIFRQFLSENTIEKIEKAFQGIDGAIVVYSGHERGDFCFWKPNSLSQEYLSYVNELKGRQVEDWHRVDRFDPKHLEQVPMIKCIGLFDQLMILAERLKKEPDMEFSLIQDPFNPKYFLFLVTAKGVNKGSSVEYLVEKYGNRKKIIAAGNDDNDTSLLRIADIKIAMRNSPKHLLKMADFIAPPVEEMGIISALEQAVLQADR